MFNAAIKYMFRFLPAFLLACAFVNGAQAAPECIVPAKPGGGLDLVCRLVRAGWQAEQGKQGGRAAAPEMQITYLPGGIGAVAWNSVVAQRRAEPDTLVAFSGGSLLNLVEGKYGRSSPADVRWVAALGADYGMIAVPSNSPYKSLRELIAALKSDPAAVTIGGSGTIGSQDWLKIVLIAKQAGIDPKSLRMVAFEGGGDAFTALLANHVQVMSGDVSEGMQHVASGAIRVLAVLSDTRLGGVLANVPTAREQGFDVSWPIIRGVYMGREVSDADYRKWVARFDRMLAKSTFQQMRAASGLQPFAMTGPALTEYIKKTVDNYGKQAKELGLVR